MSDDPGKPELEEYESPPGEDIKVATAEFCNIYGGCEKCEGQATVEQLRSRCRPGFLPDDLPDNQIVFCTHWCHAVGMKTV